MENLMALVLFGLIVGVLIYYKAQLAKRARWNYQWYASEFPDLVKNGRVICYKCSASNIGIERLMRHTYLRAHVCRQCGTTLYYSSEA